MKHKVIDVPPYIAKYKVLDKLFNNICVAESNSLYEMICYVYGKTGDYSYNRSRLSYTLKREYHTVEYNYRRKDYTKIDPPRYVIVTESFVPVNKDEVLAENLANRKLSCRRFSNFGKTLVRVKNDSKKIKSAYRTYARTWRSVYYKEEEIYYSNVEISYFRHPRTLSEARFACAHEDEYGFNFVRPRRNYVNLPNSYDDIGCNVYKTGKSWKHNSKRRKQWIPKNAG